MISWIRKQLFPMHQPAVTESVLKSVHHEVASCTACRKYLNAGLALRLMAHLGTDHSFEVSHAIDTAERMMLLRMAARRKK